MYLLLEISNLNLQTEFKFWIAFLQLVNLGTQFLPSVVIFLFKFLVQGILGIFEIINPFISFLLSNHRVSLSVLDTS